MDFPPNQRDVTADGPPFAIDKSGDWRHGGDIIARRELIEFFASILRRTDDGTYWIWHPGERCKVAVVDAPFVIDQVDFENGMVTLTPRYRKPVELSAAHPLTMQGGTPYIDLGRGLTARCTTKVYYELVRHAAPQGDEMVVTSAGQAFSLGKVDAAA